MANFPDATRNILTNAAVDSLDTGVGTPTLIIGTTGMAATLLTFNLNGTNAFGDSAAGTATGTGLPIAAAATGTGTAAAYEIRSRGGIVRWSGTSISLTGGTGEVRLSDLNIVTGNSYNLTVLSYTSPAS